MVGYLNSPSQHNISSSCGLHNITNCATATWLKKWLVSVLLVSCCWTIDTMITLRPRVTVLFLWMPCGSQHFFWFMTYNFRYAILCASHTVVTECPVLRFNRTLSSWTVKTYNPLLQLSFSSSPRGQRLARCAMSPLVMLCKPQDDEYIMLWRVIQIAYHKLVFTCCFS